MKKIFYLTVAILSLIASSCNKNDDEITDPTINNNSCRMISANDNKIIFQRGDETASENIYTETNFGIVKAGATISRTEIPMLSGNPDKYSYIVHSMGAYGINYCIEYDNTLKAARWTAYRWDKDNSVSNWNRNDWRNGNTFNGYGGKGDPFQPDPVLPTSLQVTLYQHESNGYDRGHMLGSADRLCSKLANGQSFYLSNMHPQTNAFNASGIWYSLENALRQKNVNSFRDTLYVVKGGTVGDVTIDGKTVSGIYKTTDKGLVVPKYFFVAVVCYKKDAANAFNGYKAIAFWMEHYNSKSTNYSDYCISIDELERRTGIDFFPNLPDYIENKIECSSYTGQWGW